MRKTILFIAVTSLFLACNNEKKADTTAAEVKSEKSSVPLPMMPTYSSSFEMGNLPILP